MKRQDIEKILERVTSGKTVAISSEEIAKLCRFALDQGERFGEHLNWCGDRMAKLENENIRLKERLQ